MDIELRFNPEHAHLFVGFAVRRKVKAHIKCNDTEHKLPAQYLVTIFAESKQQAFEIGAAWHAHIKDRPELNGLEEFITKNRIEQLEKERELLI